MTTNAFAPLAGGVARSVEGCVHALRAHGTRVVVVAPFSDGDAALPDVVRVDTPAPAVEAVQEALDGFHPHLVHSHDPFLLGETALRYATAHDLPLLYTHHAFHDHHASPGGPGPSIAELLRDASTAYADLCDAVIAPSASVARILTAIGVTAPIVTIPTGVDLERFARGDRSGYRTRLGIPLDSWVVGYAGRLTAAKNILFLARSVARYLATRTGVHFLVVGEGPAKADIEDAFRGTGAESRVHFTGFLDGDDLVSAYRSMDVFAFTSKTETESIALAEAMAAGVAAVALDAPGVREVVTDGSNGRLLRVEDEEAFADGLSWVSSLDVAARVALQVEINAAAQRFDLRVTTRRLLEVYESLVEHGGTHRSAGRSDESPWALASARLEQAVGGRSALARALATGGLPS